MFVPTERLLLRPAWPEDAEALYNGIADEGIVRNLARAPWPYTREDADLFVARADSRDAAPSFLIFARTLGTPRLVGGMGLMKNDDGFELGYWIARAHWGLGYATEAGRAIVAHAKSLGIGRMAARHAMDNPASGRVLRKIGFRPTGATSTYHSLGRGEDIASVEFAWDADDDCKPGVRMPIYTGYDRLAA